MVMQTLGSVFSTAAGVDWDEFNKMSGGLEYVEGGPPQNVDEVVVDEFYAQQNKIHAGVYVELLGQKRRVAGVVKPGKLNRVFMDLRRLQELTSNRGNLNTIYVKADRSENIPLVLDELKTLLPGYPIYTMEEFVSAFTADNIPYLSRFTSVMIGIAVFIGFAVVCLSMYMSVLQRTREIGILKSLGASRWYIVNLILREAVLLALVGTILGIAMSYAAKWLLQTFAPALLPPAVDPSWWPAAALIALFGAVLGALYPGLRAARMDPIEALSYE
jgi:putative ABC transport system permease protein